MGSVRLCLRTGIHPLNKILSLPIPYWAVDTWPGEPFLAKTAWKYVLLALQWARKYGLRVYLEIHTAPGSQNGTVPLSFRVSGK